ncbi:MAG: DHH family phosphoesterase [Planctomycetota bacterium]
MNPADYTTPTLTLPDVARRLLDADGPVLVITHAKPDGDAFGSVVSVVATLRNLGREARGVLVPPVPAALAELPGAELADVYADDTPIPFEPALVLVVDTGAWSQLGPLRAWVEPRLDRTLIVDHHLSGDIPAADRFVEGDAAAACEVLAELIELVAHHNTPAGRREGDTAGFTALPPVVRDALFVGIASDTGWFRFSNVRPQTHELAAKLIRQGTDHAALYQRLEQAERPEKLALLTRALQNLQLHGRGRAAVMPLRAIDFHQTGALPEETERLIDTPQMVSGIDVFVVVTEAVNDDGSPATRMSFRSKPGDNEAQAVNVAALAARFGGGGHARAAGAKVDRPIDDVLNQLADELESLD